MKLGLAVLILIGPLAGSLVSEELCRIEVIDSENGWPVPLVELQTNHHIRFHTDNAGVIAFDAAELMGVPTWFEIEGHGYSVPPDEFGYRGVRLVPEAGKRLTVRVDRQLPAKRLGRITGSGIFGQAQRLGEFQDWKDQGILGCDSVQNAIHDGKLFWAWGDTTLPGYPLGLFDMISATTTTQPLVSFEPPVKLRYDYFCGSDKVPRAVAQMPGSGPTWMSGYVSLPDQSGKQRLVGTYVKVRPPLTSYELGLCVWDDQAKRFKPFKVLWKQSDGSAKPSVAPEGHVTFWTDSDNKRWVLFGDPFPRLKCPATFEAWANPDAWQALEPQKTVAAQASGIDITPHRGSIAWSPYRSKWVTVFCELGGSPSALGELWYAESDAPTGPWGPAVKVVTHNNYTFYNPRLHPEFTPDDSPILLFEATYTATFADHAIPTPRHDYNQVLYRLDLDDPALKLPAKRSSPAPASSPF